VPGRGYLSAADCSWFPFRSSLLQRCCPVEALQEHYSRFGPGVESAIECWVRTSPQDDAAALCGTLLELTRCAKADASRPRCPAGKAPIQPVEAAEGLFPAAKAVILSLAKLCWMEPGDHSDDGPAGLNPVTAAQVQAGIAFGYFVEHRMIALPGQDEDGPRCLLLHMGEAFWSVHEDLAEEPCAAYALKSHYGSSEPLRHFFTKVLRVKHELSLEALQRAVFSVRGEAHSEVGQAGEVGEGLQFLRNAGPALAPPRAAPFDVDEAASEALRAACASEAPEAGPERQEAAQGAALPAAAAARDWVWIGNMSGFEVFGAGGAVPPALAVYPDPNVLQVVCSAFGLHPRQVAFAFDPSGRCVCEERLFLDVMQVPRSARLSSMEAHLDFWASELAHAVAHRAVGPQACEELLKVQMLLRLSAMEVLRYQG